MFLTLPFSSFMDALNGIQSAFENTRTSFFTSLMMPGPCYRNEKSAASVLASVTVR